jgi:hypothetical protein
MSLSLPASELAGQRFKNSARAGRLPDAGNVPVPVATHREVMAVYNDDTRTILLADTWRGRTPVDVSILVLEVVHHLQSVNDVKYECPGAREKPAYLAQDQWLKQFGLSLTHVFEIDAFTLLIASACWR